MPIGAAKSRLRRTGGQAARAWRTGLPRLRLYLSGLPQGQGALRPTLFEGALAVLASWIQVTNNGIVPTVGYDNALSGSQLALHEVAGMGLGYREVGQADSNGTILRGSWVADYRLERNWLDLHPGTRQLRASDSLPPGGINRFPIGITYDGPNNAPLNLALRLDSLIGGGSDIYLSNNADSTVGAGFSHLTGSDAIRATPVRSLKGRPAPPMRSPSPTPAPPRRWAR